MARQNYWESDFIAGEVSPRIAARVDLQKYSTGVAECTNFIVQLQGGVARRSGTVFVNPIKDQTVASWFIPFIIEGAAAYVIEMGNLYFRFYTLQGQLITSNAPLTDFPIDVTDTETTCYLNPNSLIIGMTYTITGSAAIPDGTTVTITYGAAQTLSAAATATVSATTATLTPNSQVPVEVVTPYTTADLPLIDFAQSADVLLLTHPSYPPQELQRTTPSTFIITPLDYQDGPYMTVNQDQGCFLTHSGFTKYVYTDPVSLLRNNNYNGTGTITATGTVTATGMPFAPFLASDIGRWVRILQGEFWGAVQITGYTSSTIVTGVVFNAMALGDTGSNLDGNGLTLGAHTYSDQTIYPTYVWRIGSWSPSTGWPSTVTLHQGRACFSNTPTEPQGWWASESGIFNLFSPTENDVSVIDSDGIGYTIVSNQLNSVQWMLSGQALMLGTFGSEYAVITSSNGTPLTPSNIAFQQQSSFGSKKVRPFLIGVSILYVQRSGKKLREQTYDWSINGWRSIEISMLSEHLFREGGGITQAAYQQEPGNNWWGCRADGTLVGMTYVKEQNIIGFHKHVIGGTFAGGQAVVESICVIPTPDGSQDQLWMIVKRTINGATARYVEYMDVPFDSSVAGKNTMNFVDSGLQSTGFPVPLGSAISHITGLDHLIGESVAVCANGSVQPNCTVANDGSIDLESKVTLLTAGLPYISRLKTLSLPVPGDFGTAQGVVKRIDRIIFRILDTLTFKVGKDCNNLTTIPFATTTSPMDASPPLFTGDKPWSLNSGYDTEAQFVVQADLPYPCNLLGMSPQLVAQPK